MNNTLSNGLDLLLHLADSARDHALSDLSRALELPKSHVHRLLQTLVASQYVEQGDNRRYRISAGALRLGRSLLINLPIRRLALPILTAAMTHIQKPLTLAIPFGHQAISIACASHDGQFKDSIATLGTVLPAHSSACGKLFLAHMPEQQRVEIIRNLELTQHGPKTILDTQHLYQNLEYVIRDKHAINNQENSPHVVSVAVAIYDAQGLIIAALGISESISDNENNSGNDTNKLIAEMLRHAQHTAYDIQTHIQQEALEK